tara:strand:+ start:392 stop:631 length:240 start_codon:yes stop_codon:yes gene_type:complete
MMMTKYQLEEFNRAFTSAVESTENHEADNAINWNFVDADVTMAMHEVFGSELDDSELEIEFNFAAEKYLSDYGHWAHVA